MGAYGAGGALLSLEELLGLGCGRILEKGGRLSKALLNMWWGMGLGLDFGMTCCGDTVLKVAFPVLFGIARLKDASVADDMEVLEGSNQWNASFTREAYDRELEVFVSFLQVLHSVRVRRGCEDKLWWTSSKRGLFKVNALFYSLACNEGRSFPWESLWLT